MTPVQRAAKEMKKVRAMVEKDTSHPSQLVKLAQESGAYRGLLESALIEMERLRDKVRDAEDEVHRYKQLL